MPGTEGSRRAILINVRVAPHGIRRTPALGCSRELPEKAIAPLAESTITVRIITKCLTDRLARAHHQRRYQRPADQPCLPQNRNQGYGQSYSGSNIDEGFAF